VIENYQQCPDPWTVKGLSEDTDKDAVPWAPQITTPMPLEALYSLMKENVQLGPSKVESEGQNKDRNVINGESSISTGQNIRLVTAEYFQDLSLKIDVKKINDAGAWILFSGLVLREGCGQSQGARRKHSREESEVVVSIHATHGICYDLQLNQVILSG
jgi:UDP-N-acetyl-D-mannosaminuronic acid transferase (WecB/TagA/CpsF family)